MQEVKESKFSNEFDLEKMNDCLETIRASQSNKMKIQAKVDQNLILTFDPEERVYYVTTLKQLHPENKKSKFIQILQFDPDKSHRGSGFKKLKKVQLKFNKKHKTFLHNQKKEAKRLAKEQEAVRQQQEQQNAPPME